MAELNYGRLISPVVRGGRMGGGGRKWRLWTYLSEFRTHQDEEGETQELACRLHLPPPSTTWSGAITCRSTPSSSLSLLFFLPLLFFPFNIVFLGVFSIKIKEKMKSARRLLAYLLHLGMAGCYPFSVSPPLSLALPPLKTKDGGLEHNRNHFIAGKKLAS